MIPSTIYTKGINHSFILIIMGASAFSDPNSQYVIPIPSQNAKSATFGEAYPWETLLDTANKYTFLEPTTKPLGSRISQSHVENENFKLIEDSFSREYTKYRQYISIDHQLARDVIKGVARKLAEINFERVAVEISPQNAVKFKFILKKDVVLIVTKALAAEGLFSENVIFSLFVNRELVVGDVKNIQELVDGINTYLSV